MLRFILEKETWLPVAQKDGQPRDRTELSPSCLVLSGRQGPRAPTCGGGRAGPRRGEPRPFSHSSPLGTQLSRRPTEKRGGASRPGGVRACVGDWGLPPRPRQGAVARPPRLPLLLGGGDTDQGTPTRFVAICCCFVHKLEAASELSRFRKCLSRTRLSHRTAQRRLRAGAGAQAAGAGRDAGPRAEAPPKPGARGPTGPASCSSCEPASSQAGGHPGEGTRLPGQPGCPAQAQPAAT